MSNMRNTISQTARRRWDDKQIMIPQTIYSGGEHQAFRDTVRRFVDREIAPHHAQWEKDGVVSRDLWNKAGAAGLLCPAIPEEYGGGGGDFTLSAIVTEELSRG